MSEQDENQNFAAKFREAQKEIDRLRRLEAAVGDDELACYIATEHICRPTSCGAIETYRAVLCKRMKGE